MLCSVPRKAGAFRNSGRSDPSEKRSISCLGPLAPWGQLSLSGLWTWGLGNSWGPHGNGRQGTDGWEHMQGEGKAGQQTHPAEVLPFRRTLRPRCVSSASAQGALASSPHLWSRSRLECPSPSLTGPEGHTPPVAFCPALYHQALHHLQNYSFPSNSCFVVYQSSAGFQKKGF